MSDNDIKSFNYASKKAAAGAGKAVGEFVLNGETLYVRALKDSHLAFLVHKAKSSSPDKVIAAVLDFTEKALLPESAQRFEEIVLDLEQGLEMEEVVEVFEHILTLVTAVPPTSPSSSSPRRRTTGSRSAASTRAKA